MFGDFQVDHNNEQLQSLNRSFFFHNAKKHVINKTENIE